MFRVFKAELRESQQELVSYFFNFTYKQGRKLMISSEPGSGKTYKIMGLAMSYVQLEE